MPEADLAFVASGQTVTIRVEGIEEEFPGTIDYVAPEIDPHTRTARARVRVANPKGVLRANMYGRGEIALGAARASVMVPREAVQRAGDVQLVFVKKAADLFETRRVKLGVTGEQDIEILAGVTAGEEVVTTGSFLLKTETLKGAIGAGCCEAD